MPTIRRHITAESVPTDVTNFNQGLTASETDVQLALEKLDDNDALYLLLDGTRAMGANLNMATFEVLVSTAPSTGSSLTNRDYVDSLVQGLDWQESVLDFYDPTSGLPAGSTGDRYISEATANGWTINNIYEYNGATWDETVVNEGMATWVEDPAYDSQFVFNGTLWVRLGSTIIHNNLSQLNVGNYLHITALEYVDFGTLTGGGDAGVLHHHDGAYYTKAQTDTAIDTDITTHAGLPNVHHNEVHNLDGVEHTGIAGVQDNFMSLDVNGRPQDSGFTDSDFALIGHTHALLHTRLHTLDDILDHTGIAGTTGNFMALNASGLPVDSSSKASDFATSSHIHTAAVITVNAAGFSGNLSPTDIDVQTALVTIDALVLITSFLGLSDTPGSYSGAGKVVRINPGNNGLEFATVAVTDELVKVSATDTTTGYLNSELTVVAGKLTKLITSPAGDEKLELGIGADVFDKTADDATDVPTIIGGFGGILSGADTTVQLALDTIDDHNHDGRYYTETELDAGQLDNRYYTETELDAGQLDNLYFTETEHINSSVGGVDAGKPIVLDAGGLIDGSMIDDSDIDHVNIANKGFYTHTQIDTHINDATLHFTEVSIDHGSINVASLGDDDHPQYHNGTLAYTGILDMGSFAIINVGNVDGVDISAHKTRHQNGGLDEISVAGLSGLLADPQTPADHAIDSTTYHDGVAGATLNNIMAFDANGLPKDSGIAGANIVQDALNTVTVDNADIAGRNIRTVKVSYTNGGVTVTWDNASGVFATPPTITFGIELNGLSYQDYLQFTPIITANSATSMTFRVNKVRDNGTDLIFEECATNDVDIHIIAEG